MIDRLAPLALVTGALHLALAGCTASGPAGAAREELRVERGEFSGHLLLTGELVAAEAERMVVPNTNFWPVSLRWLVEDGATVEAGERLAEFDGSQLAGELENLENALFMALSALSGARSRAAAELDAAAFELEQKQAAHEKAKLDAELPENLLAEQEMAQRRLALEKNRLELEQAQAAVEATEKAGLESIRLEEIKVAKAERALLRARHSLEALTLRAPRDGIALVTLNNREGRPYQTGDNTWPGLAVVTLPDLSSLRAEAELFDVDDGRARPGQRVTATLDAFPSWQIGGVIRSVDSIADETDRQSTRRIFRVTVDLDEVDVERMRPGMSVKVEVRSEPRQALLVPRAALDFSAETPRARLADGTLREVEIGDCTARFCALESGLDEGTELRGP